MSSWRTLRRRCTALLAGLLLPVGLALVECGRNKPAPVQAAEPLPAAPSPAADDSKKPRFPRPPNAENVKVVPEAWKTASRTPLASGEIDRLLAAARKADAQSAKQPLAPLTTDEQFIRRVSL